MYIEDEAKDDRLGLRGTRSILLEADVRAIKRWSCIDSRFGVLSCCRLPSGDRFCLSILVYSFGSCLFVQQRAQCLSKSKWFSVALATTRPGGTSLL